MKNLLTYISPEKWFNDEHRRSVKIQIDNSLALGWNPTDIILVTNFDYEYRGVKALVIGDENYCVFHYPATKIYAIAHLFQAGLLQEGFYWYHDFDCFELHRISELEVKADIGLVAEMGLTNYGRMPRLCSASIFFRDTAADIFQRWKAMISTGRVNEEHGIMRLIQSDSLLRHRVKLLNITYAFHRFNVRHCYARAIKPIRAAHFHLTPDKYDFYVRGQNKLQMPLVPPRLVEVFSHHGFQ